MAAAETLIAEGLHKTYRIGSSQVEAVNGVSLTVRHGEIVVLRGRSGSGKSTLLNVLGLLTRADGGRMSLCGVNPLALTARGVADLRAAQLGFVFQAFNLLPHLTAVENVTLASRAGERRARARALELLDRAGLANRATHRPAQLSGGEQQRVALVRALMNRPALVLADEPTGNLDAESEALVLGELRKAATAGCAVVIASHSAIVCASADRAIVLSAGRLATAGVGAEAMIEEGTAGES
jgi:putative ABC transport system ATP-binding protein